MRLLGLTFLGMLGLTGNGFAQGSPVETELTITPGNGYDIMSWDSVIGEQYLIEYSTDLETWDYLPQVFVADGTSVNYWVQSSSDKIFFQITATTVDLFVQDSDNDGYSDAIEVQYRTDRYTFTPGPANPGGGTPSYSDYPVPPSLAYSVAYRLNVDTVGTEIANPTPPRRSQYALDEYFNILAVNGSPTNIFSGESTTWPIDIPVGKVQVDVQLISLESSSEDRLLRLLKEQVTAQNGVEYETDDLIIPQSQYDSNVVPYGELIDTIADRKVRPLKIVPDENQKGINGDLVPSNLGTKEVSHYVSPKKNDLIQDDHVILKAQGFTNDDFEGLAKWEGGEAVPGAKHKRRVARDASGKYIVKLQRKDDGSVADTMIVWVVWANLAGQVQNPVVSSIGDFNGISAGDRVDALYTCTATITPAAIITDMERPKLSGGNEVNPPGNVNINGDELSGGANKKWDISRRVAGTVVSKNLEPPMPEENQVREKTFAMPQNPLIGNDDAGVDDETNDPYNNNQTLTSSDPVQRGFGFLGGHENATHQNKLEFEEFVRLEINRKWFLISGKDSWEVHFKFKKEKIDEGDIGPTGFDANGDGDITDPLLESNIQGGTDFNGDGDTDDVITRWIDDTSTSKN